MPVLAPPGTHSSTEILDPTPFQPGGPSLRDVGFQDPARGARGKEQLSADPQRKAKSQTPGDPHCLEGDKLSRRSPPGSIPLTSLGLSSLSCTEVTIYLESCRQSSKAKGLALKIRGLLGRCAPEPQLRKRLQGGGRAGGNSQSVSMSLLVAPPASPYPPLLHPLVPAVGGRISACFAPIPGLAWCPCVPTEAATFPPFSI